MKIAGMEYKVVERSSNYLVVGIMLGPDFEYFEGHFEDFKLLAALIQIKLSIDFSNEFFEVKLNPTTIPKIKCSNPIKPNQDIFLSITWDDSMSKMSFKYFDSDKVYALGDLYS